MQLKKKDPRGKTKGYSEKKHSEEKRFEYPLTPFCSKGALSLEKVRLLRYDTPGKDALHNFR